MIDSKSSENKFPKRIRPLLSKQQGTTVPSTKIAR